MRCLYCHEKMTEAVNLVTLFEKKTPLCLNCRTALSYRREGRRCSNCHRIMGTDEKECMDCRVLNDMYPAVRQVVCMLDYNEEVKMLFQRFKFMRDAALMEIISMFLKFNFGEYDVIIPIPVSEERLFERGYNQTTIVLDYMNIRYEEILMTDKTTRQSGLLKQERMKSENPFRFKAHFDGSTLAGQKVLIVDDIYTTGITTRQAAVLLYTGNPALIDVLTFSKA